MNNQSGVTLQISLAPTDLPTARYTLPHQLRQWAGQVDEVLLVVDLHQSRGRFAEGWKERLPGLRVLIEECCAKYSHAHTVDVDYSTEVAQSLSTTFFNGQPLPSKDWNGGPFYSYFFGLYSANHKYVFHMDADMMYGGGSTTWVTEAVQLLSERPDIFICSPLPGPPTSDGCLRSQVLEQEAFSSLAFCANSLSSRHFFMDRDRFSTRIRQLSLTQPPRHRIWQALVDGNPPYESPEVIFSRAMQKHGLKRIEFLGKEPGSWSLHPPYHSQLFYDRLPKVIQQIEANDIPEAQRGCHDINNSMVDWTGARKSINQRVMKHLKLALQRFQLLRFEIRCRRPVPGSCVRDWWA